MELAICYNKNPSLSNICDSFVTHSNFIGRWFVLMAKIAYEKSLGLRLNVSILSSLHRNFSTAITSTLSALLLSGGKAEALVLANVDMLAALVRIWRLEAQDRELFPTGPNAHSAAAVVHQCLTRLTGHPESVWNASVVELIGSAGTGLAAAVALGHLVVVTNLPVWNTQHILIDIGIGIIHQLAIHHSQIRLSLLRIGAVKIIMSTLEKTLTRLPEVPPDDINNYARILNSCAAYFYHIAKHTSGIQWSSQMIQEGILRVYLCCDPWSKYLEPSFLQIFEQFQLYCVYKSFLNIWDHEVTAMSQAFGADIKSSSIQTTWSVINDFLKYQKEILAYLPKNPMMFERCTAPEVISNLVCLFYLSN